MYKYSKFISGFKHSHKPIIKFKSRNLYDKGEQVASSGATQRKFDHNIRCSTTGTCTPQMYYFAVRSESTVVKCQRNKPTLLGNQNPSIEALKKLPLYDETITITE